MWWGFFLCEQTFKESSYATYKVCSSMKKVVFFFKWYFFFFFSLSFPPHLSPYTSKNDLLTHHILPKNLCRLQWYYYSSATSAATKIPSLPPINKRRRLVHIIRVIYDSIRNRKNYFEILPWTRKTKNGKIQSKRYTHWRLGNVYSPFWFSLSWRSLFEIQKRRQFENILPVISLEISRHFSKILQ